MLKLGPSNRSADRGPSELAAEAERWHDIDVELGFGLLADSIDKSSGDCAQLLQFEGATTRPLLSVRTCPPAFRLMLEPQQDFRRLG